MLEVNLAIASNSYFAAFFNRKRNLFVLLKGIVKKDTKTCLVLRDCEHGISQF